jgi:hypothetical protein
MRNGLRLGTSKPATREWALASLAANAALPGSGTLLAGRWIGYLQLGLALVGVLLSLVYGIRFIHWYVEHRLVLENPDQDPWMSLWWVWREVRMAWFGIALFMGAWLWAMGGSLVLLWKSRIRP